MVTVVMLVVAAMLTCNRNMFWYNMVQTAGISVCNVHHCARYALDYVLAKYNLQTSTKKFCTMKNKTAMKVQ
jgi:hypothetical protein